MGSAPGKPRRAVIAGPTATGKSAHALALAKAENGIVINADASQVYRDLEILSARPSAAEAEGIPHRLYGVIDGSEACTAARWCDLAKSEMQTAWDEGCLPILVGGTGMYINILLNGIAPVPEIDESIRNAVRALGTDALSKALAQEDPAMAAKLRPSDTQRQARALEVIRSTGRSLADWQQAREGGIADAVALDFTHIDLPRSELYARCEARFDRMIEAGAVDEVDRLSARNLDPELPVMKAIGVPPLLAYLAGEIDLDEASERAKRDTRRYAKRQQTWFRTQSPVGA